jgi:photoactive yellow protein
MRRYQIPDGGSVSDTGEIRFDMPDLIDVLETLGAEGLDALGFGVIAMAADGVVVGYNDAESALSGLAKDKVIGRHFFSAVAPCTNNFMVSHCYEAETDLDRTIDYVFTLRMKPRKVKLRMLKRTGARSMYLAVRGS